MKKGMKVAAIVLLAMVYSILNKQEVKANSSSDMAICGTGSFKSYMSMTKLNKSSPQYQFMINNTKDDGRNLRITSDGYLAVAMGSYYGVLGDKFEITFANGTTTKVVKVDEKADAHTSAACKGMSMSGDSSIIEVITSCGTYDKGNCASRQYIDNLHYHGNAGTVYDEFAGNHAITNIKKINGESKPKETKQKTNALESEDITVVGKEEETPPNHVILFEGMNEMIIYLPNEPHKKLLFLDTEFNEDRELVQAALILLESIDKDNTHFFLTASLNVYVNVNVGEAFENFTGIKRGFLGNEGLPATRARETILDFIEKYEIDSKDVLLIGHGLKQDMMIMNSFGCRLDKCKRYDTHLGGAKALNRTSNLKLEDLLLESGYAQGVAHDAYQDARNLIPVYSHIRRIEDRKRRA